MNPYVSHLEFLPSSFATCDLATQALSPSDLTSCRQQEKETLLCPNTEEKQGWETQTEDFCGAESSRNQCLRSNFEMTMLFING